MHTYRSFGTRSVPYQDTWRYFFQKYWYVLTNLHFFTSDKISAFKYDNSVCPAHSSSVLLWKLTCSELCCSAHSNEPFSLFATIRTASVVSIFCN